jgi:hypothetical protein
MELCTSGWHKHQVECVLVLLVLQEGWASTPWLTQHG